MAELAAEVSRQVGKTIVYRDLPHTRIGPCAVPGEVRP